MKKSMRNANTFVRKLSPVSIRATNYRLEVAKKERRKREEMVERLKAEAMVAKQRRVGRGIGSPSTKEDESDTGDDMNSDQSDDKYLLQFSLKENVIKVMDD